MSSSSNLFGKGISYQQQVPAVFTSSIFKPSTTTVGSTSNSSIFSKALKEDNSTQRNSMGANVGHRNIFGTVDQTETSVFGQSENKITPVFGTRKPDLGENVFSSIRASNGNQSG